MSYITTSHYIRKYGQEDSEEARSEYDGIKIEWEDINGLPINLTLEVGWDEIDQGSNLIFNMPQFKTGSVEEFLDNFMGENVDELAQTENVCSNCGWYIGPLEYEVVKDNEIHETNYCGGCGEPVNKVL